MTAKLERPGHDVNDYDSQNSNEGNLKHKNKAHFGDSGFCLLFAKIKSRSLAGWRRAGSKTLLPVNHH